MSSTIDWYTNYADEKGKHFSSIQPSYSDESWYKNKQLSHKEERSLNCLMTGHRFANNWLAKMKIVDDPD